MSTHVKRELPILTRAESELMQLLWKHGPLTVNELMAKIDREVAYTTVLTIVRILEQKGYATHDLRADGGRAHLYRVAVAQSGACKRHVRDLIDRLFGGRVDELVTGLIEDEALSRAELKVLRAQIDERLSPSKRGKQP